MKAYHFMMGMFLFNISVALFNSLGIWEIGYGLSDIEIIIGAIVIIVVSSAAALGVAAVIPFIGTGAQNAAVYSLFSLAYLAVLGYTDALFYSIFMKMQDGNLTMLIIFNGLAIIVLAVGLYQMATGGWQSYE